MKNLFRSILFYLSISAVFPMIDARASEVPPELLRLIKTRDNILKNLIEPIIECWNRQDTTHTIFSGCIDWHSACHAGWAILAYSRVTGDDQYIEFITKKITLENIKTEAAYLEENPTFEMPYGRAWFLRFAIEYRRKFSDDKIIFMTNNIFNSLMDYYKNRAPNPMSYEYNNDSWALINMIDYAKEVKDFEAEIKISDLIQKNFMKHNDKCKIENDRKGFMAVCSNWAWLVSKSVEKEKFLEWYKEWNSDISEMEPLTSPSSSHEHGLNFSRAWGLMDIFDLTLDPKLIKCYINHFNSTYNNPKHWKNDYNTVGHWVAQFGILAALPLYGKNGQ